MDGDLYKNLSTFDASIMEWPVFKYRFETFLESKELLHIAHHETDDVTQGIAEEEAKERRKNRKVNDAKVRSYLIGKLSEDVLNIVRTCKTAYEMFQTLNTQYQSTSTASSIARLDALLDMEYKTGSDISSHIGRINSTIAQLKDGGQLDIDKLHVVILLRSMPKSKEWDSTITALKMIEEGSLTKEKVARSLTEKARELSMEKTSETQGGAFYAGDPRKIACWGCGQEGVTQRNCRVCQKKYKPNRYPQNGQDRRGPPRHDQQGSSANFAFMTQEELSEMKDNWYIDSGATRHYTNDISCLKNVRMIQDSLRVADKSKIEIHAVGDIVLNVKVGDSRTQQVTLHDVYYAPKIAANLLSDGVLDRKGLRMTRNNGQMVYRNMEGKFIFKAEIDEMNLFPLQAKVMRNNVCMAEVKMDKGSLWHRRMGHISDESLMKLAKGNIVIGEVSYEENKDKCEICALSKANRRPFKTSTNPRAKHPLDLVHIDILEIEQSSRLGETHALVMIDDYSDAKFVFPLKKKSDAVTSLKLWLPWAERMADRNLKCIRSDNARELKFGEMQRFLEEIGVEQQFSTPYEHEQNGKAERANRTILEKARSMLIGSGLHKRYWRDALLCAAFVANRTPVRGEESTPIEKFTGIKPDVSKIRVFGCKCWARKRTKDITGGRKLDERSTPCRFLGYTQGGHSYLVESLENGKVFESTNITHFEEFVSTENGLQGEKERLAKPSFSTDFEDVVSEATEEPGEENCKGQVCTLSEL